MIDIQELDKISPEIETFQKTEWEPADIEHFGRIIDWKKDTKVLNATDNNELVGVLELTIQSGVMHIDSLIVKHKRYGQGIGKALMTKAEELAKKHNLHKIGLDTGKNWPATKFYKSLGYEKTGDLPKHLEQQDYIEFSKFL
jgi:ribosomal protein S18 acetylase RimI-like enzyme